MSATQIVSRVRLQTAGNMGLEINDRPVALSSRKALAIITYLALQANQTESRERVATMLWSDSGPDQARGALRQTLRRLKQDLGEHADIIDAGRNDLRLVQPVEVDILEAAKKAEQGQAPRFSAGDGAALDRLFDGLTDLDPDLDLWIAVQRERLSALMVSRLETALLNVREDTEKLGLAEALSRTDPAHEGACRAEMEAHIALGDTAQAMRCYERLWRVLDEDLDVEPSEKTQSLYVAIKQGVTGPAIGGGPSELTDLLAPIAIVVEPTQGQNLTGDFDFFGMIFRDEMIAALSRFRDWLTIDGENNTPSPPAYRSYSLRIMLHQLNDSIIAGLKLFDLSDNHCVWADRYTVTLEGIVAMRQTALRQLAVALNVHLSTPRLRSARESVSPMGRKYELWMQAQALAGDWRAESDAKSERILRDLIADMPDFAPAQVALAQSINARPIVYPGQRRTQAGQRESLDLTSRAVKLDPLDSRTHLCRAWSHAISGSHSAALSHLDLALDLNENDPWTIISAALGFGFAGELDRARDLIAQVRSFGMRHSRAAQGYVATVSYLIGDYAGASEAAEVAGDAIINLPAWQAASRVQMGDMTGAAQSVDNFLHLARSGWCGPEPNPSDEDIFDWFVTCFPVRSGEVMQGLHDGLLKALDEKKRLG